MFDALAIKKALMSNANLLLGQILGSYSTTKRMHSSSLKRMKFMQIGPFTLCFLFGCKFCVLMTFQREKLWRSTMLSKLLTNWSTFCRKWKTHGES